MDRKTVDVYEQRVDDWITHRRRPVPPARDAFARRTPPGMRADLGCGPGWHSAGLGQPVVALDAAFSMVERVSGFAPAALRVQGDLERLPFRPGALSGAWAHKCYMHLDGNRVPLALAELHRSMALGGALHIQVTSDRLQLNVDETFPGRHFEWWPPERLRDVAEGAGFDTESFVDDGKEWIDIEATRARMLPDTVGPDMHLLLVGLNPSLLSADTGVGFARPGNRFWPAALAAGIATRSHDPYHLLREHAVGMTNLVRRATARADELTADEYHSGGARLERLVRWLQPRAVCFVGVTGYRVAVDKRASLGWQPEPLGDVPVYVMPNTSGLNAHTKPAGFAEHLRVAGSRPPT